MPLAFNKQSENIDILAKINKRCMLQKNNQLKLKMSPLYISLFHIFLWIPYLVSVSVLQQAKLQPLVSCFLNLFLLCTGHHISLSSLFQPPPNEQTTPHLPAIPQILLFPLFLNIIKSFPPSSLLTSPPPSQHYQAFKLLVSSLILLKPFSCA